MRTRAHARGAALAGTSRRTSVRRTRRARCAPSPPGEESVPGPGSGLQRGRKAGEAAATSWDSRGATCWGAACTCVPVFIRGRGYVRAAHSDVARPCRPRGFILGGGSRWSRTPLGRAGNFRAAPALLALALGIHSLSWGSVRPLGSHLFSNPKARIHCKNSPPPRPPPPRVKSARRPKVPLLLRAARRAPRPETSLSRSLPSLLQCCWLERESPSPLPARPARCPRHSQVAAAGQDEKDLRAIDGEERAARRQQEHGGPALLAGLDRPCGQGA